MGQDVLVEIQPPELKFVFELKKQSLCSIQLVNKSNEYVAFKVKTTSPKRYCVRPNVGIILPMATCDFTVTLQAQKEPPPDMQLKDKFLVQTTTVPHGTKDEDIVSSFFSKESGRYIQDNKMKVVLVSPPQSSVHTSINGTLKQEAAGRPVSVETGAKKAEPSYINPFLSPTFQTNDQIVKQHPADESLVPKTASDSSTASTKVVGVSESPISKETSIDRTTRADVLPIVVARDVDELKLKLNNLEGKLNEAEKTIKRMKKENTAIIENKDKLQKEIAFLRSKTAVRFQSGFPPLFVVFIALLSLVLGHLLHY